MPFVPFVPIVLVGALLAHAVSPAQSQHVGDERGLSGYVLAPDGSPVSGGNVVLQSPSGRASAAIDRTGRFRLTPDRDGLQQLAVSVPGLTPYRLNLTVPPSRTLELPVIRLRPGSYFRVRFVSSAGEAIIPPRLRRQFLDSSGYPIAEPPDLQAADHIDSDGSVIVGPLPLGRTMLALDAGFLAQTRVPDVDVTEGGQLLDGGTIVIQRGAVLHVDVVDGEGAPLPAHDVFIEDAQPVSPLTFRPSRTNEQGRATFDRLAAGRYRLRTRAAGPCVYQPLTVTRVVSVPGTGTLHTRLVVGGTATFRLSSPLGPLSGVAVSASPDPDLSPPLSPRALPRSPLEMAPFVIRPIGPGVARSACPGTTDANGRVTFPNFPPGPARIDVRLSNSTYVRLVAVPDDASEMVVQIAEGFLPLRVASAPKNEPIAGAVITWTGGGARVEGTTVSDGHALLEGVGASGGTLEVTASGYQAASARLAEAPSSLHEVVLPPAPATGLHARVTNSSGEPVVDAVVLVARESPVAVGHVAATDATGVARFMTEAPAGTLLVSAHADGLVTAAARVPEDGRSGIVLTLARGYRILADVELPTEAGVQQVRVMNEARQTMDGALDVRSDRSVQPRGRTSLGPLPPGTYIVEMHGATGRHEQRIEITDRDVQVTFR